MQRILSSQLSAHAGETVHVAGWIHRRRLLKSVAFLILRDAAGLTQIVVSEESVRAQLEALPEETAIAVTGTVTVQPSAPGGVEITAPVLEPLTDPAEPVPFDLYRPDLRASLPTVLDHAPVALRHPKLAAVHRIGAAAVGGFRAALEAMSFVEIHTPKIVGTATESGANVFKLDYFGRPAYLAQSPQLYKQIMVGVFERVYEVGPVFRAEPSDTARHLASYTSLDAEMGFIEDHRDVIAACHATVAGMLAGIQAKAGPALELLDVTMPALTEKPVVVHFADVLEMISKATGEDVTAEPDLAPAHERWIGEWALREHGSDFVFVEGYPTAHRAFYTHPDPARPGYSRAIDLIFRGLELVSGGQRLHRHADYVRTLTERGETDLSAYAGYLDAMRYGMPPHGGFAFGLERFLARLLDVPNIRQVTLFPRDLHRLTP
ncbi:aspartate--tRNA(Asn) ligase [Acrocarpospora macrocephala]|uniref:Aspartate--tRNA(Asp/Asn) ligase n=1 Tax=Acrocarpospora macrocephala TaxID=150177 RepID=A0A5M3WYU4_9ACTN|nr:aspartate--tRNA(Asn) ligase [Acrocarpospora macrocephala]GES13059.1 aspartate--tRNA(Asp/Asn) ligase [Acrocarpospora macrocephala]